MDFKIELIPIAVTDIDRTKDFYASIGWEADQDHTVSDDLRFVQVTPPGSAASFCFGKGLEMLNAGSKQYIQVVIADADEAYAYLKERGIDCTPVDEQPWGRFVTFEDPDGNRWALQQIIRAG